MEKELYLYLYFNLGYCLYQRDIVEQTKSKKVKSLNISEEINTIFEEIAHNDPEFMMKFDSNVGIKDVADNLFEPFRSTKEMLLWLGRDMMKLSMFASVSNDFAEFKEYGSAEEMKKNYVDLILQIKLKMNRLGIQQRIIEIIDKLNEVGSKSDYIDAVVKFHNELLIDIMSKYTKTISADNINKKVFIVHGHDDGTKETVARLIEKIGYEVIILHEQPNKGRTIIEKFEDYADVSFAIILYSPDDNMADGKVRARQNVIFEHGFFVGKLGRGNVVALHNINREIEILSDLSGVIYIPFDLNWKNAIINEMIASGLPVDKNKI